jgi:hypothetical protein
MITEHGRFALPGNQMTPLNDQKGSTILDGGRRPSNNIGDKWQLSKLLSQQFAQAYDTFIRSHIRTNLARPPFDHLLRSTDDLLVARQSPDSNRIANRAN